MPLRLQITVVALLAALLAAAGVWFTDFSGDGAATAKKRKAGPPTLVLVDAIGLTANTLALHAIGTGEAARSAAIHPSVAGEVVDISFRAGQRVKEGTVLLRLDDKHQRLAVRLARVNLNTAERHYQRVLKLAPSGAASRARLETAEADLEAAKVRLDQAAAALSDRAVRAPFDGIISLSEVDKGDRVTPDTEIATLDDRSTILVDFLAPEAFAARIKTGDPVTLLPWTRPGVALTGEVFATGSRIDPESRSLKVRAAIANPDDDLRPGTSFEVRKTFVGKQYPSVREVAVLWSRDGAYVWRIVDDRAEKVYVKLVRRDEGRVLVDGPLQAGDRIVVEGVQGLRPGQKVTAEPYPTKGTAAAPPAAVDRDVPWPA